MIGNYLKLDLTGKLHWQTHYATVPRADDGRDEVQGVDNERTKKNTEIKRTNYLPESWCMYTAETSSVTAQTVVH